MKTILTVIGVLAIAVGLLWIGQGLGFIDWPKSSFMIDQRPWAIRGGMLAVLGVVAIVLGRRR